MRTTKVPAEAPPLVEKYDASIGNPNPGGGRAIAAKLGLCAGLFAFLLGYCARVAKVQLSPGGHLIVMVICTAMILSGLALAVGALVANRRGRRRGVVGFAIAALIVNGLLAASLIYSIVRVAW